LVSDGRVILLLETSFVGPIPLQVSSDRDRWHGHLLGADAPSRLRSRSSR